MAITDAQLDEIEQLMQSGLNQTQASGKLGLHQGQVSTKLRLRHGKLPVTYKTTMTKEKYLQRILEKGETLTFKQLNRICGNRSGGIKCFKQDFLNLWRLLPWLTIFPERGQEQDDSLFTFIVDADKRRMLSPDAPLVRAELDEVAVWKRRAMYAEDALKLASSGTHVPQNRDMVVKIINAGQKALLREFGHDTPTPNNSALQELTVAVQDVRICAGIRKK